ncbi:MAG: hypothetical protein N3F10_06140 [Candidatus Bathyarchaeota archaeon]|nr:hypothetical protein [Candidatus Bathyarchaeota archaeon]
MQRIPRTLIYMIIVLICSISALATLQLFKPYSSSVNNGWKTCEVTFTTATPTFTYPYRHVREYRLKVYVADAPEKLQEGYKFKHSYDFLGKGASGILLDVRPYAEATITITMHDVRLPLTVIVLSNYNGKYKIINWRELAPEEDWTIKLPKNDPLILELDPSVGREILERASAAIISLNSYG